MELATLNTISPQKQKQIDQQAIPVIREKLKQAEDHLLILIDSISEINPGCIISISPIKKNTWLHSLKGFATERINP